MSAGSKGMPQGGGALRLPVHTFDLPIHEIRRGYCSDVNFWREKLIFEAIEGC